MLRFTTDFHATLHLVVPLVTILYLSYYLASLHASSTYYGISSCSYARYSSFYVLIAWFPLETAVFLPF